MADFISFCANRCVELPDEGAKCEGPGEAQDGGMSDTPGTPTDSAVEAAGTDTNTRAVVSMVALGRASSCAAVDGAVKCWGWNGYGQLGDGTTKNSRLPVQVRGLSAGATAVAMGLGHAAPGSTVAFNAGAGTAKGSWATAPRPTVLLRFKCPA